VLSRSNLEKAKLEVKAMATGKRELIDNGTDKRYVRRDEKGQFDQVVDVGRSLSQDRKRHAENESKPGHGDRGDRKRLSTSCVQACGVAYEPTDHWARGAALASAPDR